VDPPKVMKNSFCSAATLPGSTALPFVISTEAQRSGEISVWMLFLGSVFSTEESWTFGPPKVMKNSFCSAATLWKHRPSLCHLDRSAAEWRDLRVDALPWKCFFDRGVMDLRPTQGDEKQILFSNYSLWKHRPSLCHLDRSAAEWRDLCVDALPLEVFFRQRSHGPSAHPR
jgi:hypothetical protein